VASGLIYLNSHASDFKNPQIRPYLDRYLRGSNGYKAEERVKLLKLLWDALASEFGGRHELYEINYGARPRRSAAIAYSARRPPATPTASRASPRNAWRNTTSTAGRCRTSPIPAS
jgi:aromatic ring hydroxylase